jgi:hypothetical protein
MATSAFSVPLFDAGAVRTITGGNVARLMDMPDVAAP